MGKWGVGLVVTGLAVSSCQSRASDAEPCEGAERCACYPNDTCDEGLVCLSELCVEDLDANAGEDAAPDAGHAGKKDPSPAAGPSQSTSTDSTNAGGEPSGAESPSLAGGAGAASAGGQRGSAGGAGSGTGGSVTSDVGSAGVGSGVSGSAGATAAGGCGSLGCAGGGAGTGAGLGGSSAAGAPSADECALLPVNEALSIPIVYRDFKGIGWHAAPDPQEYDPNGHPDFENETKSRNAPLVIVTTSTGDVYDDIPGPSFGLVETMLGQDGDAVTKPVFRSTGNPAQLTGATEFQQWYVSVPGVNIEIERELSFDQYGEGRFLYGELAFYPIDDAGLVAAGAPAPGPEALRPLDWLGQGCGQRTPDGQFIDLTNGLDRSSTPKHNFSFTTELRFWFEYHGGESVVFEGDDDAWIFVNGHLVVDLGGLHAGFAGDVCGNVWYQFSTPPSGCAGLGPETTDVDGTPLGLVEGARYEIAVFQAERHTCISEYSLDLAGFTSLWRCGP